MTSLDGENNQRVKLFKAQCSNLVRREGTKVLPATLGAVEHQVRQLLISIKPTDVVGTGAFELFVII